MATPAERLEREKKKRTVLRNGTTRLLNRIERELQEEQVDSAALDVSLAQIAEKEAELGRADTVIEELITDLDALENEISTREEYKERIIEGRVRVARKLRIERGSETASEQNGEIGLPAQQITTAGPMPMAAAIRLPRLTIEKFNGDACSWQNFWAQFSTSIHENHNLTKIDKFNYLKAYLEGAASIAISGLPMNSDNYEKAVKILTQRFGRRDALVSAHMNKLLNLPAVKRQNDVRGLRRLYDDCEIQVRSLETMGMVADAYGSLLCPLLFKLIPDELALEFNRRRDDQNDVSVAEMLTFIRKEVESRERTNFMTKDENSNRAEGSLFSPQRRTSEISQRETRSGGARLASAVALSAAIEDACVFCNKTEHKTDDCNGHSIQEKKEILRNKGRCYICYKKRHLAKHCHANVVCPICKKRHRKSLCWQAYPTEEKKTQAVISSVVPQGVAGKRTEETVLLQTVRAVAVSSRAKNTIRCLLDGGSQRTFIKEEVSRKLKLQVIGEEQISLHTFGREEPISENLRRVKLKLRHEMNKNQFVEIEALEISKISTATIQIPSEDLQRKVEGLGISLSDQTNTKESAGSISVLIGSDFYWQIVTGETKRLSSSLVAVETKLGWTIQGIASTNHMNVNDKPVGVMKVIVQGETLDEQAASEQLKCFWELDSLGIIEKSEANAVAEDEVLREFKETVTFTNGRYNVHLPWKADGVGWPDNFKIAERRLQGLIRKFQRDPVLYTAYNEIIEDQLTQGIIEEVRETDPAMAHEKAVFYLPHQAVVRPNKTTTKTRIVFDASAHSPNAPSLNDLLHAGPNLNPDLVNLLIKFRTNEIAVAADIEKAFLQIELAERDRDAVRFLWTKGKPHEPLKVKVLRMSRVLFGVKSSPFLLAAVIRHHLDRYQEQYPKTCVDLRDSMYVDDWTSGADTIEEAFRLTIEARDIMKEASFSLRKWHTNSEILKEMWKGEGFDACSETTAMHSQTIPIKVLGLLWNTKEDVFKFDVSGVLDFLANRKQTKRCVLQAAGRIFDPIGFLAPFIIRVKMLFQSLWELGLQWDEELHEPLRSEWNMWCKELTDLYKIEIPRFCTTGIKKHGSAFQLHCFTDASEKAYGAVVYLRYTNNNDAQEVTFIASKTRVAPLKKLSIPRLELMGALIGARLVKHIKETFLEKKDVSFRFWSDSIITLCWVRSASDNWKPFVSNRVQEIQLLSNPEAWQHCPGSDNPADLLTRGKTISELVYSQVWWKGPSWLRLEETDWPKVPSDKLAQSTEGCERRNFKTSATHTLLVTEENRHQLLNLDRYSNLNRILRVTAWTFRFVHNARVRMNTIPRAGPLETYEIEAAERHWVKEIQKLEFKDEMAALTAKREIDRTSKIVNLNPFLDKEGILRVGGRLQHADLSYDQKHPWLLPGKSKFSALQIKASHERIAHGGLAETMAQTRDRLWIIKARQLTKNVLSKCLVCRRLKVTPLAEAMAPLPGDRVKESPPFTTTGIDFAGPIYTRESAASGKSYIALFTCAVTRAIHLELVSDLSTEKFILAFRRFISRRGVCKVIYSDNAKTFKSAEKRLRELWNRIKGAELKEFFGTQGITWKYIVERAAWWGGFWERMVRTVKNCLKKMLGRAALTFEELTTALTQVEAIVNSRPITYASSDCGDLAPLTPAHFLVGKRLTALPECGILEARGASTRKILARRFAYQQRLQNQFWNRWKTEYLLDLKSAHFSKTCPKTIKIQEGDIVIIDEIRTPRLLWKMARVTRTFQGRDGKVRSCELRLADGTVLRRPIQLLYPLEIQSQRDLHSVEGREDVVTMQFLLALLPSLPWNSELESSTHKIASGQASEEPAQGIKTTTLQAPTPAPQREGPPWASFAQQS